MPYYCPLCGKKNVGAGHKHFGIMRKNIRPYGRKLNPLDEGYAKNRSLISRAAKRRRKKKKSIKFEIK
jgi:hypothetical protein